MSCLFSQQSFELTAAPGAARARRRAGGIIYTAAALRRDLCIKGALKHVIANDSLAIIYLKVANHLGNLYEQPIFHGPKGLPADEKEGSAEKKIRDFIFKSLYRGKPWVALLLLHFSNHHVVLAGFHHFISHKWKHSITRAPYEHSDL